MKINYQKGISAVEILVVVAALILIAVATLPQFFLIRERAVMNAAVSDLLSSVNKAKSETLSSLNSSEYGVHFQSDKVIIFKGTSFSAGASGNEIVNINTPAAISNVTFGGVSAVSGDVYFSRIHASPSTTGTITISTSSFSKVITIYATGVISSN